MTISFSFAVKRFPKEHYDIPVNVYLTLLQLQFLEVEKVNLEFEVKNDKKQIYSMSLSRLSTFQHVFKILRKGIQ